MIKKIVLFVLLAFALVACNKTTNAPKFVCYYYNRAVSLPATDDMPEMSSQIYRDIECPLPTNEAWTKIHDSVVAEFLNDTTSNCARFDTADLQKLYEYPAVVVKDTESTYAYRHNNYISLRTCHLDDSVYGYYCHTKWYDLGAHGSEGYYYRYFCPKTGERLKEQELFHDWFRPMFSYYLTASIKGRPDKGWGILGDSIVPNGNFIIAESGLTYVFNQYEIGCFAIDTTVCTIPLSILKECIRSEWRGLWDFNIDEDSYSDLENESILYAKLGNEVISAILEIKGAASDWFIYKKPSGKAKLAQLAEFPFFREYPMKDIQNEKEFVKQFDMIFSDYMLEKMCHMRWQEWMRMGWRGIMHWDGEIWVDEFPDGVKLKAVYDDSIPAADAELRRLELEELTLLGEQDTNCVPAACYLSKDSSILVHISCKDFVEWKNCLTVRVIPRNSNLTCPSIKAKGCGRAEGNSYNHTIIARDGNTIIEVWDNSYCYSKEQKEAGLIYGCQISDVGDAEIDLEKYESFSFDTAIPLTPVYLRDVAKWWKK